MTTLALTVSFVISEALTGLCLLCGAFFCVTASIGLARMPDLYMRMQTATKAGTLGVGFLLLGVALQYRTIDVMVQCGMVVLFLFLTAPIASHLMARSAYLVRIRPWEGSVRDELAGCYDHDSHRLSATPDLRRAEAEAANAPVFRGDETMFATPTDRPLPPTGPDTVPGAGGPSPSA